MMILIMIFQQKIYLINMKNFKETKTYTEILNFETEKTITIPYHLDMGIIVSEENIEYFIQKETVEYLVKLNMIQSHLSNFDVPHLKEIIINKYQMLLGKTLPKVEYAYVNKSNIDDAINEIESLENFIEWLVD